MNAPLPLPALDDIRAHEAEMVEIRRQIHANPEMAYEECHRRSGGRAAAALGLRGAPRPGRHRRGRHAAPGHVGPPRRPARRHGRAADHRDQRQALGQQGVGHDARLRPRRPHGDAAVGGAPPGGDAQFRRPPAPGVPAGRRRPGRRAPDARGRLPRALPLRGHVRHAQHARHTGRQVRGRAGFCDGQRRHLHHQGARRRRARRDAARGGGHHRRRVEHRHGAADHRLAQRQPAAHRHRLGRRLPFRRCAERAARRGRTAPDGARLPPRGARPAGKAHRRDRADPGRGVRRHAPR